MPKSLSAKELYERGARRNADSSIRLPYDRLPPDAKENWERNAAAWNARHGDKS